MTEWHQYVGLAGTFLYISSYFLLQTGKIDGDGVVYVVLNLTAASLVLFSLSYKFNLASSLIQISWILISIVGLIRLGRQKAREISAPPPARNLVVHEI